MPSPFGHLAIAYLIHKSEKTLSLPALVIGSIISDLDLLFYYLTSGYVGRELLHSFVGGGVIGTLLSTFLTVTFYPLVVSSLFGINKKEIGRVCRFSKTVLVSSFIGVLSHILIDSTCHNYNPLLYPFTTQSIDVLLLTSDWELAYIVVDTLLLALLLIILTVAFSRKGSKGFWERILVGND